MNTPQGFPTAHDVISTAGSCHVKISPEQASKLLIRSEKRIRDAMNQAAREVIREEVESYMLDEDDRDLD